MIFNAELVEKCHLALPPHIREYLHKRGLSDAVINEYKLGYGQFYRKPWITIPYQGYLRQLYIFQIETRPKFRQ
jgi:DNA primase